jgi:hypothetical protein
MIGNQREKKKINDQKLLQQAIESQRKDKERDNYKKESLGPLRQGQRLDTIETKTSSHKEQRPPKAYKATNSKLT